MQWYLSNSRRWRHDENAANTRSLGILAKPVTKASAGKHGVQTLTFSCSPGVLAEIEAPEDGRKGASGLCRASPWTLGPSCLIKCEWPSFFLPC